MHLYIGEQFPRGGSLSDLKIDENLMWRMTS